MNEITMTHEKITVEISGPDGETKEKTQHVTKHQFDNEEEILKNDPVNNPCSLKK